MPDSFVPGGWNVRTNGMSWMRWGRLGGCGPCRIHHPSCKSCPSGLLRPSDSRLCCRGWGEGQDEQDLQDEGLGRASSNRGAGLGGAGVALRGCGLVFGPSCESCKSCPSGLLQTCVSKLLPSWLGEKDRMNRINRMTGSDGRHRPGCGIGRSGSCDPRMRSGLRAIL